MNKRKTDIHSKFIPNNIVLRELSAMCQAEYLSAKAIALNQLQTSEHKFSTTAREILALKYDMWFQWLVEVEYELRRGNKDVAKTIVELSDRIEDTYICTMQNNPKYFVPEYLKIWLECHTDVYSYLHEKISVLSDKNINQFMIDVTKTLIEVMETTLYEVHELDNLFAGGEPFVSFSDICYDYVELMDTDSCLMVNRLEVYDKYFDLHHSIIVKDYSKGEDILKEGPPQFMLDAFSKHGFTVEKVI